MKFIKPTIITDAMLISSTVSETDYTAWNAATAYALGDRCIRTATGTHKIYERAVPGTTATAPESDTTNWIEVGATNRWKMFDQAVGSVTSVATPLTVVLAPGLVQSLALLDITASTVRVSMLDAPAGTTVFDQTYAMIDDVPIADWYEYYFGELALQTEFLIIDDLPPYSAGRITVTLNAPTTAECGTLVVGRPIEIGVTTLGAGVGIIDYSRKETDAYGVTSVLERAYAKRVDVPVWCATNRLDYIVRQLADVRAIPCVWIASDNHDALVVYGFFKDWNIDIRYQDDCEARLTIEGLT